MPSNKTTIKKNNKHWFDQSVGIVAQTLIEELKKFERVKMESIPHPIKTLKNINRQGANQVQVSLVESISKANMLKELQHKTMGNCKRCELCQERTNIVFGVGNPQAKLVFVGEAPGADEDAQAEPFVGRSGKLLTKMIQAMGFKRSDIYICNVVKCRPPKNRDPLSQEVATCELFLKAQLAIIKPKVVVALGRYACQSLLKTTDTISSIRGKWTIYENIPLMPTFHPAYLLRNGSKKKEVWEDLQEVMSKLE